jgi:predicted DNA-binding protein YlxM (UPF0122 family)
LKDLSIVRLYDCYSPILSEKQRTVFELYYDEDLSLSEIAEHTHTTRQGVRDLLKRSEEQLRFFEQGLGLCRKIQELGGVTCQIQDTALREKIEKIFSGY